MKQNDRVASSREAEGGNPLAEARRTSIVVGLVAVILVSLSVMRARSAAHPSVPPNPPPAVRSSAAEQLSRAIAELESLPKLEGTDVAPMLEALEGVQRSSVGSKLPDGRDPPRLPDRSPKVVRVGVVLVRYRGAQLSSRQAPPRDAAMDRAKALQVVARSDFSAAVAGGDDGSSVDIGTLRRGVLEAGTEYVVFTLPVGGVSEVLDTPRGFWIVRRIH